MRLTGGVGFPHSLGVFYTAVTQFLGFPKFGDEHKVMSLAPYGEPAYLSEMRRIVRSDGLRFKLDLDYFRHHQEGVSGQARGRNLGQGLAMHPRMLTDIERGQMQSESVHFAQQRIDGKRGDVGCDGATSAILRAPMTPSASINAPALLTTGAPWPLSTVR